jgi:hypothetical protein
MSNRVKKSGWNYSNPSYANIENIPAVKLMKASNVGEPLTKKNLESELSATRRMRLAFNKQSLSSNSDKLG